ncbi:MAG: hypothetical protein QOJ02_3752 [Acidobacteriota bacterium]|nr:hypothetical protein [Acidobacteriota bacterium]
MLHQRKTKGKIKNAKLKRSRIAHHFFNFAFLIFNFSLTSVCFFADESRHVQVVRAARIDGRALKVVARCPRIARLR